MRCRVSLFHQIRSPPAADAFDGQPSCGDDIRRRRRRRNRQPSGQRAEHRRARSAMAAIDEAERDPAVRAIVVIGAGRTFIAGADIKDLERAAWDETVGRPTCTICCARSKTLQAGGDGDSRHGARRRTRGGDGRALPRRGARARVGLPEANLGIIPGAEGTQRLPRLVGVEKAIEMCVSGKPVSAPDAHAAGLIDRADRAATCAPAPSRSRATSRRARRAAPPDARAHRQARHTGVERAALRRRPRSWRARSAATRRRPLAAIDAIEAAATLPFDEGRRRERALAIATVRSEQCQALVHAFFAERAVPKVPGVTDSADAELGRSARWRSSAPARWAAASPWRARTPACAWC